MDMMIGAMVGLRYARFDSLAGIFNAGVSLGVVVFYGAVTVLISIKVWIFSRRGKDHVEELHKNSVHRKWDFLQIGIKKQLPFA
jgi:hypothetical protein